MTFVLIPMAFAYMLTRDTSQLSEIKFSDRWGKLYEGLKIRSRWQYSYYLFFILRRVAFVGMAVFIPYEHNSFQIMGMIYLNMFIVMYQGLNRPMIVPLHNKIEFFNEALIGLCTILMMCYTEWIPD